MFRQVIAAGMAALYLLFVVFTHGSFAMHSTYAATGDYNVCGCGCTPENRVSNNCCCSKKRQQPLRIHEEDTDASTDNRRNEPDEFISRSNSVSTT